MKRKSEGKNSHYFCITWKSSSDVRRGLMRFQNFHPLNSVIPRSNFDISLKPWISVIETLLMNGPRCSARRSSKKTLKIHPFETPSHTIKPSPEKCFFFAVVFLLKDSDVPPQRPVPRVLAGLFDERNSLFRASCVRSFLSVEEAALYAI